ncbi:MAG: nucleotidyltransferase family protein [Actinobacteria bacterium]|nr:nucleotidyltransferase family protein [Actinomycetota bacterium]
MSPSEVHAVLDALRTAGVPAVIDGGWGVDALLGEQTRPHRDVDLVIARDDVPRAERALAGAGYAADPSVVPGLPARREVTAPNGRSVDLHLVVMDQAGAGWQELGDGGWGHYPAAGLAGAGCIGGRWVRCVTVELQLRHHLGYPPLEHDLHDMRALAARFGIAIPPGWRSAAFPPADP